MFHLVNRVRKLGYYASLCIVLTFMNRIAYFLSAPLPPRGDNILIFLNYILRRRLAPDLLSIDKAEASSLSEILWKRYLTGYIGPMYIWA